MRAAPVLLVVVAVAAAGCGGSSAPKAKGLGAGPSTETSTCKPPKVSSCEAFVRALLRKTAPAKTQTTYNHCDVELWSGTRTLTVKSAVLNNDHDDWTPYPGPAWDKGPVAKYGSTSGFARGCSNTVRFSDGNGTVEIYVSDPYHGSNDYYCKTTGSYTCAGPLDSTGEDYWNNSRLDGDDLKVVYLACLGGRNCWGPFMCARGGPYPCGL